MDPLTLANITGADLQPLTDELLKIGVTIAAGAIGWAAIAAKGWFNKHGFLKATTADDLLVERLKDYGLEAINFAKVEAGQKAKGIDIKVDKPFLEVAVKYLLRRAPDTIKHFEMSDGEVVDYIKQHLGQYPGYDSTKEVIKDFIVPAPVSVVSAKEAGK